MVDGLTFFRVPLDGWVRIGALFGCFAGKVDGFRFLVFTWWLLLHEGRPSISNPKGPL